MTTKNDIFVTKDVQEAGAVTYWRLSGGLTLERLRAAWTAQDLPAKLLPEPVTVDTAAHRAVHTLQERRRLVRPLERRGAWVLVDERVVNGSLQHTQEAVFRLVNDQLVIERMEATEEGYQAIVAQVTEAFEKTKGELGAHDIGSWLVSLAYSYGAVSLRDSGGVYFVPRTSTPLWYRISIAVENASAHNVFRIPAMRTDEAITALTEAITTEADRAIQDMEEELQKGELGARALSTREQRCKDLLAKVGQYENLLEVKLDALRGRLNQLATNVTAAAFA